MSSVVQPLVCCSAAIQRMMLICLFSGLRVLLAVWHQNSCCCVSVSMHIEAGWYLHVVMSAMGHFSKLLTVVELHNAGSRLSAKSQEVQDLLCVLLCCSLIVCLSRFWEGCECLAASYISVVEMIVN